MEIQTYFSKTLITDDPSPSKSFFPEENLDGFSQVSPLMVDSLSGSSSVAPMTVESLDLEPVMENLPDEDTIANPRLSETPSTNDIFSLTSLTPLSPSTESEPSQPLALVPYEKPENCQEEKEDPHSSRGDNEFKTPVSGYSTWNHWWSRPLSPPKPTGVVCSILFFLNLLYLYF